jgi:hypothetical protein
MIESFLPFGPSVHFRPFTSDLVDHPLASTVAVNMLQYKQIPPHLN